MKSITFNIICCFLFMNYAVAQKLLLSNEKCVISFTTNNGKTVMVAKDKNHSYLIYRFGTINKIELEFPEKTKESWNMFKYSYYLRGGGIENEGLDLDFLAFVNGNIKYVVYNTYAASTSNFEVGIKVIQLDTGKVTTLKGKLDSLKGDLMDFRYNGLVEIVEELYE